MYRSLMRLCRTYVAEKILDLVAEIAVIAAPNPPNLWGVWCCFREKYDEILLYLTLQEKVSSRKGHEILKNPKQ